MAPKKRIIVITRRPLDLYKLFRLLKSVFSKSKQGGLNVYIVISRFS